MIKLLEKVQRKNYKNKVPEPMRNGNKRGYHHQRNQPEQVWNVRTQEEYRVEVATKNKFRALEDKHFVKDDNKEEITYDKRIILLQNEAEGKESQPSKQKTVTKLSRRSESGSINFYLNKTKIGLEQSCNSENSFVQETGNNGTPLEAKTNSDNEKEGGRKIVHLLEKENVLTNKEPTISLRSKIDKLQPHEIKEKLDTEEEEEGMFANIHHISREGDLSPRQIGHLKGKYGINRNTNPDMSYVNTKSRRNRPFFQKTVEDIWELEETGSPFIMVQTKMKKLKITLVQWSKTTFGNIFQQVDTLEDIIRTKEVQGIDHLSPTLFIIEAEVLARSLNQLFKDQKHKGFGLPKWSPEINHLSYADDTIYHTQ
ncbi:hypothetical protein H5410_001232 [Solanum commersonii]|uniref:Reverse transcriptase domain-containing protein n=1 Tax=Solanum commersonii TaxID=4109 RepID=A0A9J6AZ40_SOLCO|nr:hypothetical protein H5410_001232 [Solanum commersonii]